MMLTKQKRKQNKSPMIRQIEKHLNRRTEYQALLKRLKKKRPQPWVKGDSNAQQAKKD